MKCLLHYSKKLKCIFKIDVVTNLCPTPAPRIHHLCDVNRLPKLCDGAAKSQAICMYISLIVVKVYSSFSKLGIHLSSVI